MGKVDITKIGSSVVLSIKKSHKLSFFPLSEVKKWKSILFPDVIGHCFLTSDFEVFFSNPYFHTPYLPNGKSNIGVYIYNKFNIFTLILSN